jgi:VCBS repeat-containing protein
VDGPGLTFSIVTNGAKGTATLIDTATGAFTYTPTANANGPDTVTFQASDGTLTSNVGTVAVSIAAANDAPVATDGTLAVTEDVAAAGTFVASDPDSPALTFEVVSNGTRGTATITNAATGAFTYTPNANVNGPDTVTFRASDGTLTSNIATVTIAIAAVNDPPAAQDGTVDVAAGGNAAGSLIATDIDSPSLTFAVVTNGSKGTAVVTNATTGAYTYSANAGTSGADTFTFQANDGTANSNIATITVTITTGNQPPVASSTTVTTLEDRSISGRLAATDPERAMLTFSIVSAPGKGTATITNASTGRFTYVPNANSNGADSFMFHASDGTLTSNIATVSVTVTPVNDAPTVTDQSVSTTVNQAVSGTVQGIDVDGDALTYVVARAPRRGTLSLNGATGAFVYTPNPDFQGKDTFAFRASDGSATSNTGTVSITVNP